MNLPSAPEPAGEAAACPPAAEAVLLTDTAETRYRRAGSGSPVLLLFPDGARGPLGGRLFSSLRARFRVIAPEPPAATPPALAASRSTWLRDLIDGLGLVRPGIVADEALGVAALEFLLLHPERVSGLITVSRDRHGLLPPEGGLSDRLEESQRRLLLLRMEAGDPAEQALAEAARFLEANAADPVALSPL